VLGWESFEQLYKSVFYLPNEEAENQSNISIINMEVQLAAQHLIEDQLVIKMLTLNAENKKYVLSSRKMINFLFFE
jgi:hypothetical protein